MSKEIEAQILFINYPDVMSLIKKMGGELKFDWIKFRIAVFNPCLSIDEQKVKYGMIFTRVRDEGKGIITITTKVKPKSTDNKYATEYEIESKNTFEECRDLLIANHLNMKSYQERLRQKWIIKSKPEIKEIVFDIWPGLPPYMEIEAKTEQDLLQFLSELNIDKKNIRYSGAGAFYKEILGVPLDVINNQTPILDFKSVQKSLNEHVSDKNKFNEILENQKLLLKQIKFENLIGGIKYIKRTSKRKSKKNSKRHSKRHSKRFVKN